MSDNELIADFMGVEWKKDHTNHFYWHYEELFLQCDVLMFDTSWDWLMPVIQKIANMWEPLSPLTNAVEGLTSMPIATPIENVYAEIISTIKWINQLPK